MTFRAFNNEIKLLEKSKILAVFSLFKKSGTESIIWGLAEDEDTKERFHWITDIETDISILVNQFNPK